MALWCSLVCSTNEEPNISLHSRVESFQLRPLFLGNSLKGNQLPWGSGHNIVESITLCAISNSMSLHAPSSACKRGMQTVQIMIGVVVFLFGIVTAFYASTVSSHTGIMFWGAIIYIIAGSLTVRAVKMLNPCLVKASLGMNIFSTITAGLAIILHSFDFLVPMYPYSYDCYGDDYYDNCYMKNAYKTRTLGIAGVTLVLSVLEFIVSICVSAFACKATCTTTGQVMYISNQVPPFVSTSHFSAPPLNTSEMPPFQSSVVPPAYHSSVDGLKVGRSEDLPPEYTPTQE
ncbi:membrane-spanning 4-domains subfamily A member 4A-like isoform X1 [Alosa alosa]|uniref:membrane-spanning 4-domains subfamily A member 4A-like isoform X1 n=1 Tax=Alosa alosa TaxID=278164 RepID=UPI0020153B1E|nr:membrane-spanning 4-domains subfamily A member 4A-like isoform X1 [Alosa alosa]